MASQGGADGGTEDFHTLVELLTDRLDALEDLVAVQQRRIEELERRSQP